MCTIYRCQVLVTCAHVFSTGASWILQLVPQALVLLKKYMPPPLPYFKVNICSFPLPHSASIFFAYLWSFRWPNYIVTLPRYFSFRLPHLNIPTGSPLRRIGQEYAANVAWSTFQSLKRIPPLPVRSELI